MSMKDVRDYLTKQLAELANSDLTGDELANVVERAKTTALVADKYIGAVKVEIEAIRLADEVGRLPVAVAVSEVATLPRTDNVRVLSGRR
jgi:hypothetical protein